MKRILKRIVAGIVLAAVFMTMCPQLYNTVWVKADAGTEKDVMHIEGIWQYRILEDGTAEIIGCYKKEGHLETPVELGGRKVTSIGPEAFEGKYGITSISISEGVTGIGDRAFDDCRELKVISLPSSVTDLGKNLFVECISLTSIVVDPANPQYDSRDDCNAIIEKGTDTLIYGCNHTVIPEGVTGIGDYAFDDSRLNEINIPSSVTDIGKFAFAGTSCVRLSKITVDPNNPKYDSRNGCNAIIETKTNTLIRGCSGTVIPNGVTAIGDFAFAECGSYKTRVVIPKDVTSISDTAFFCCTSLVNITVDSDNLKYDSRGGCNAIIEKGTNKLILGCKNTVIPDSVKFIGNYSFYNCGLTEIVIPHGVTGIGDYAFRGNFMTGITLPDGLVSIGDHAFAYCGLQSIAFPDSLTRIDYQAFRSCPLTSIVISSGVTEMGDGAFIYCSSLESITVDPANPKYDSRDDCNAIIEKETNKLILGCDNTVIPDSVTEIGDYAFCCCYGLIDMVIPDGVTAIGNSAFELCSNLQRICVPDSVTSIGDSVFFNNGSKFITTIITTKDSYADAYAQANNISVTYVEKKPTPVPAATNTPAGITEPVQSPADKPDDITDTTEAPSPTASPDNSAEQIPTNTPCITENPAHPADVTTSMVPTLTVPDSGVTVPAVPKVKVTMVTAGKRKLTIKWKKTDNVSGYQIQLGMKKNFKGAKTVNIKKTVTRYTAKKLKGRKIYYIRIRAYNDYTGINGNANRSYGKWTMNKVRIR